MAELERVIDGAYDSGRCPRRRRGRAVRRARLAAVGGPGRALGPEGVVHCRTRRAPPSAARPRPVRSDPAAALVFDWRDGDVL